LPEAKRALLKIIKLWCEAAEQNYDTIRTKYLKMPASALVWRCFSGGIAFFCLI